MKNGFTLAEVLVTLGIIGVISAMTLPTLIKNHQRQVYVTQLHKVYNEVSQALEQVITDSNAVNLYESNFTHNDREWFIRNYFKTTKICTGASSKDCFANEYKNMNGTTIITRDIIGNHHASAILTSGASICIKYNLIIVDINGLQGPNILGRDLFDLWYKNDGTISAFANYDPIPTDDDVNSEFSTECSANTGISYGYCLAKIINDGWKMDY